MGCFCGVFCLSVRGAVLLPWGIMITTYGEGATRKICDLPYQTQEELHDLTCPWLGGR